MHARSDVGSVVYSHPPHSIAIAATGRPLQAVSHAETMSVPPDVLRFARTAELIVTTALGTGVANALGRGTRFSSSTTGSSPRGGGRHAVIRAVVLEKAAHQQLLIHAFGGARRWSSDEEALRKRATV